MQQLHVLLVGAGLTLASNGSLSLQHLALGTVLADLAVIPARGAVKHFRTGLTLVDIPRGAVQVERFGAPYCQIHRNEESLDLASYNAVTVAV